jgi:hypothetical protein
MKVDPIVAISEKGMIVGNRKTDFPVMKADAVPPYIKEKLSEHFPKNIAGKIKDTDWYVDSEELAEIVYFLTKNHEPFPIKNHDKQESKEKKYWCYRCKKEISYKVAKYCFDRKNIFGGKAYCYECQKIVRKER